MVRAFPECAIHRLAPHARIDRAWIAFTAAHRMLKKKPPWSSGKKSNSDLPSLLLRGFSALFAQGGARPLRQMRNGPFPLRRFRSLLNIFAGCFLLFLRCHCRIYFLTSIFCTMSRCSFITGTVSSMNFFRSSFFTSPFASSNSAMSFL